MAVGFNDTTDLERSLLRIMLTQKMMARIYLHKVKARWFTTYERRFIFDGLSRVFEQSRALMNEQVFRYEVGTKVVGTDQEYYLAEWEMVKRTPITEEIGVVFDKLEEATLGNETLRYAEHLGHLLETGDFTQAADYARKGSISLGMGGGARPTVRLFDFERREREIKERQANPELYRGLLSGLRGYDMHTAGGLFSKEFVLVSAVTGVGKSTLLKQIAAGALLSNPQRVNVLHVTNEESQEQVERKYDSLLSGVPYLDLKRATVSEDGLDRWRQRMRSYREQGLGEIFVREVEAWTDASEIERTFYELSAQGHKVDLVMIDLLNRMLPVVRAWSEHDERAKVADDCKELSKTFAVPVIGTAQAATALDKKQEEKRRAGNLDVYGSKGQIHPANVFLIVVRTHRDRSQIESGEREEWNADAYWRIECKKNRDGPPFELYARHYVLTGLVQEITRDEWQRGFDAAGGLAATDRPGVRTQRDEIERSRSVALDQAIRDCEGSAELRAMICQQFADGERKA